jgi:MFS family permease
VLVAAGAVVVAAATWGLLEPVLPLDLDRRFGASPAVIGALFGAATLAYGLAAPLVGALADRHGRRPTMALGLVLLAVSLPLLGWLPALLPVGAALLAVSVAYGFALTPTLPELADAVDRRGGGGYGAAYAIFNVAYSVGMMAGPVLGGLLADAVGLSATLLLAGVAVLAYLPALRLGGAPSRVAR